MASPSNRPLRFVLTCALAAGLVSCGLKGPASSIVVGKGASFLEQAAAKEIRRAAGPTCRASRPRRKAAATP
jgi:hypothetical protein